MRTDEFETQLKGGRLTTAEVLYYMPDHPKLLQSFMWQTLDIAPEYPRVHSFLDYWRKGDPGGDPFRAAQHRGDRHPARVRFADMVGTLN